ncbi:3-hydroxybutyryl-CoA dehydrogenase [Streptomyces griseiscabiei]|uniref:3-hydroxybutyryl-CoA dehydrogenase n=1 Tax=Streptomyces griseiscabiei TaxID=2993540 RepID=A0ABU4L1V1_9ACTN|nr:3-hydroxybutyryl-CoA dehydrogenase [Streptomyces griseiscabiei]MBZ3906083.1 3-hydroxybutyryl-CoA dehydrogenase [Streptomyces griseiscabiei]MDX2909717.1 3-hydroxybutyryl-CoA dehydrogenase [Streptomyces griseiscabiei]
MTPPETHGDEPGRVGRVGVVGCGLMGSGIAELSALAGYDVRVAVSSPDSLTAGRGRVLASLDRAVRAERIGAADRDAALDRTSFTTDVFDLADRQLVIESIAEDKAAKIELFTLLDKALEDPGAILASNTSSLSVTAMAGATGRPGQVLGLHFFSPTQLIPLVEVIPALHTSESALTRAEEFVTAGLGKQAIRSADRTGFVVNSLLVPYLLSAMRMVESGFATAETVDRGMTLGCSHPVGPLKLADLIGLDVLHAVAEALYAEYKETLYAPPPLLTRMVEGGLLGRKTGRGFYRHG